MATKPARLAELERDAQSKMTAEYQELGKMTGDIPAMQARILELNAKWASEAETAYNAEIKLAAARATAQKEASEALKVHALDILGKVYKASLVEGFTKLDTINSLVFRVDRDATTGKVGEPTVMLGAIKSIASGSSGSRDHSVTFNGVIYDSISKAWAALMPSKPKPTELWTSDGKQHQSKDACVKALVAAGHVNS